jgi:hypothetical protein
VDADASLRRIERTAVAVCTVMAVAALVIARGRPGPAVAVVGGGLLVGLSYHLVKGGAGAFVDALAGAPGSRPSRRRMAWTVATVALRYALLAFLAYVMIARLRLHPLGLLAGASSVVAAVSLEAVRVLTKQ